MRARSIKPGIFRNELLATADPLMTLIFQGLWCMADREGRLEDRPAKIHINVNPCRPMAGTTKALDWLQSAGFIIRYEIGGSKYIQVANFRKHQNPHCKEAESTIPAPGENYTSPVLSLLTPDSGVLTPDSSPSGREARTRASRRPPEDFQVTDQMRAWAAKECPGVDVSRETPKFLDHTFATARTDWVATWRNWMRRAVPTAPVPKVRKEPTAEEVVAAHKAAIEANQRELRKKLNLAGLA